MFKTVPHILFFTVNFFIRNYFRYISYCISFIKSNNPNTLCISTYNADFFNALSNNHSLCRNNYKFVTVNNLHHCNHFSNLFTCFNGNYSFSSSMCNSIIINVRTFTITVLSYNKNIIIPFNNKQSNYYIPFAEVNTSYTCRYSTHISYIFFVEPDSHTIRSEERRVGKECRSRWSPYH